MRKELKSMTYLNWFLVLVCCMNCLFSSRQNIVFSQSINDHKPSGVLNEVYSYWNGRKKVYYRINNKDLEYLSEEETELFEKTIINNVDPITEYAPISSEGYGMHQTTHFDQLPAEVQNNGWYKEILQKPVLDKTDLKENEEFQPLGSTHPGVKMNLFDYWISDDHVDGQGNADNIGWGNLIDNLGQQYVYNSGINKNHMLKFSKYNKTVPGDHPFYYAGLDLNKSKAGPTKEIVQPRLQNGYPVLRLLNQNDLHESLDYLFDLNPHPGKAIYPVSQPNLFIVDDDGKFRFDSRNHCASYVDGEIVLYNKPTNIYGTQSRGQFFPFNNNLGNEQPVFREDATLNHYFGMHATMTFYHLDSDDETPSAFKFSGDDDMWLFFDDVLILDLGGMHGRVGGSINFDTGEVLSDGSPPTTLRALYEAAGATIDESKWDGNTFAHNTRHNAEMFYLERGNYDSNLELMINMSISTYNYAKRERYAWSDYSFSASKKVQGSVELSDTSFTFLLKEQIGTDQNVGDPIVAYGKTIVNDKDTEIPITFYTDEEMTNELIPSDFCFHLENGKRYYLVEVPQEHYLTKYKQGDSESNTFVVDFENTNHLDIQVTNQSLLQLELIKLSDQQLGSEPQRLKGAKFHLFRQHDSGNEEDLGELVDNQDGSYTMSDEFLLPGTYRIEETQAPEGHVRNDQSLLLEIKENGVVTIDNQVVELKNGGLLIEWAVTNKFKTFDLKAEKYSFGTNSLLDGAIFTLCRYDENWQNVQIITDDLRGNQSSSVVTDLSPGYYEISENTAPGGFEVDQTPFRFEITLEGKILNDKKQTIDSNQSAAIKDSWKIQENTLTFVKYNQIKPFAFQLIKKSRELTTPLAGAEFSVWDNSEMIDEPLAKVQSQSDGLLNFNHLDLQYGNTYYLKETQAPHDYQQLEGYFTLQITERTAEGKSYGVATWTYYKEGQKPQVEVIEMSSEELVDSPFVFTVHNQLNGQLPATGGSGHNMKLAFLFIGLAGIGAIFYLGLFRKRGTIL